MPNRDGKGPAGKGAKTGGQRGDCKGATPKELPRDGRGLGQGRGLGGGRGARRRG